MSTLRDLLADAAARLAGHVETPRLDAQLLLAHAIGRDRAWLYAWPEASVDAAQAQYFGELLAARLEGRPIAYLTGSREFWSLDLRVTPDTLIPRPETEQLVEIALTLPLPRSARVLDMGTGSGAIALALHSERPDWRITALERSADALEVARSNALTLGAGTIDWRLSDWFEALTAGERFDLIVANPPYIAPTDPYLERGDLRFEPRSALAAGEQGIADLRRIVSGAPDRLDRGGWLWLEHGFAQGPAVAGLLNRHGFSRVDTRADLAGHDRHSGGQWPAQVR